MMLKHCKILLACLFLALTANAQNLCIGTYNIRVKNAGDSIEGNVWGTRCKVICDQMNFEQPDAFGTQEVLVGQLHDMLRYLDGYDYIGVGRDDGKEGGEFMAIFYKKDRLKLLKNGNFWLSETPDKVSKGWDAMCFRVCTWGEFQDRETHLKYYHFNLHMDHKGIVARREAAKLIVAKVKEIAKGAPVVVTGDFNVDQNNEIFKTFSQSGLLKDCYTNARQRFAENGTFNGYDVDNKTESRIDHIFVSPNFTVSNYGILTDGYWTANAQSADAHGDVNAPAEVKTHKFTRRAPSDHYPVIVRLRYVK